MTVTITDRSTEGPGRKTYIMKSYQHTRVYLLTFLFPHILGGGFVSVPPVRVWVLEVIGR